jgi:hypothetical protein
MQMYTISILPTELLRSRRGIRRSEADSCCSLVDTSLAYDGTRSVLSADRDYACSTVLVYYHIVPFYFCSSTSIASSP